MSDSSLPKKDADKRRRLRVPLRILRVEAKISSEVFFGYASDLSSSGMFIQTPNPRAKGTRVPVVFTLPEDAEKIQCEAEVIWVRDFQGPKSLPPGMGLQFVDLPTHIEEKLQKFVEKESVMLDAEA